MISADLPFRKAERQLDRAFPQDVDLLVILIDGPTPMKAEAAANRLLARLKPQTDLFLSVRRPATETFFRRNGLLFLSVDELTDLSDHLAQAQPLLGTVARDPSLRGLLSSLDLATDGIAHGQLALSDLTPMLEWFDSTAADLAAGTPAQPPSWQILFGGNARSDRAQRFLLAQPILHHDDMVAGRAASEAIRLAALAEGITADNGMRLRLTGPVALADANFATVTEGVELSTPLMLSAVCLLLYLAVRSAWMVGAILLSLLVGLIATAAFAAATVGTLNPISVAFAIMFVGIAVDFAIQFVVRYRNENDRTEEALPALMICAHGMGRSLTLAACATAVGFLSFLPTDYSGVSQLGLIAGGGMLIALVIDFTLLPALLALLGAPDKPGPAGLPFKKADLWLSRHCSKVLVIAGLAAGVGLALLPLLPLDFNPLHLQNPKAEAVSTLLDLSRDSDNGAYAVNILAKSPAAATALADRLDKLPEVKRSMTLGTFIPSHQDEKLAIIKDLSSLLGPTLTPTQTRPTPSDDELRAALRSTAQKLDAVAPPNGPAHSLAEHFRQLAGPGTHGARDLHDTLMAGVPGMLEQLRQMLSVGRITLEMLPAELVSDWVSKDGQVRVQAFPRDDLQDDKQLTQFVGAVQGIAPSASGMPIAIDQSAKVVVGAFARAGVAALVAIGLMLWIVLGRALDAFLVVLPLVMGALYTVIGCVVANVSINFANIIALPLLLGIGVAFNIYFVVNWRNGLTDHLGSSTTRAVLFSALTTGAAFGSLALSPHLGTASMGLLLFLSLGLSVATTFVVLPALFTILERRKA